MRGYRFVFSLIALAFLFGGLAGCENKTDLEKGIDNVVDDVRDATN